MSLSSLLQKALQANLLSELSIEDLPLEQKEKILLDVTTIVNQNISLRLLEELPEEKAKELETLLTDFADDPDRLQIFFRQEVPNFNELVQEEIAKYKQQLMKRFAPAT